MEASLVAFINSNLHVFALFVTANGEEMARGGEAMASFLQWPFRLLAPKRHETNMMKWLFVFITLRAKQFLASSSALMLNALA